MTFARDDYKLVVVNTGPLTSSEKHESFVHGFIIGFVISARVRDPNLYVAWSKHENGRDVVVESREQGVTQTWVLAFIDGTRFDHPVYTVDVTKDICLRMIEHFQEDLEGRISLGDKEEADDLRTTIKRWKEIIHLAPDKIKEEVIR